MAVYARVSTDDVRQTTSFELQQAYYEEFVQLHEKWDLVRIYADEGISGTSLKHRDAFNEMLADARRGKIDLIITKSVSRFARNVKDFLTAVHELAEHVPPIGVFFESENIFSLRTDRAMPLSLYATMAEEESRSKSRSMEISIKMRLDHGLPLTPKLLGFSQNEEGKLIPDPDTYRTPRLMFFMCLFGYSTQQIADKLTALGRKTYLGNLKWSASGVVETLRNERYCGDVFTRKTFTRDVLSHKSIKNRGERARSLYRDEHEAIVSRDDFLAVQMILNNSKYRNKGFLPELEVITEGLLKGYVVINPRWGSFSEEDYVRASSSAYEFNVPEPEQELTVETNDGDFDYSGFEIAQMEFGAPRGSPMLTVANGFLSFSKECLRKMPDTKGMQLLVHPEKQLLAVRPAPPEDRHAVKWSTKKSGAEVTRLIPAAAFTGTLFSLFGWDADHKYRLRGTHLKNGSEEAMFFSVRDASVLIRKDRLKTEIPAEDELQPLETSGRRVVAVPEQAVRSFGKSFYEEKSMEELVRQTPEEWKINLEGRLCSTGIQLNVTPYETLKAFIQEELGDLFGEDEANGQAGGRTEADGCDSGPL